MPALETLSTAFFVLFASELGDKTQFAAVALSLRYSAGRVIAGVCAAHAVLLAAAVALGQAVGSRLDGTILDVAAGLLFLVLGLVAFLQAWRGRSGAPETSPRLRTQNAFLLAFATVVVMELGDKSQLAALGLAARTAEPLLLFLGAWVAVSLVAVASVLVAGRFGRRIPLRWLELVSAGVFLVFGAWLLFG